MKQPQVVVRTGLEPGTAGFQVRCPNHSATRPPLHLMGNLEPRVSPAFFQRSSFVSLGDQPLTKKPEDSGFEIVRRMSRHQAIRDSLKQAGRTTASVAEQFKPSLSFGLKLSRALEECKSAPFFIRIDGSSNSRSHFPGGGGTQQSFIRGGSAPRLKPLPFCIPFLVEKVPLSYTLHRKLYLFHIPTE